MSDVVSKIVQQLGAGKLLMMLALSLSMIIGFTFISMKLTAPTMSLLYGGLAPKEASLIVEKISAAGITYEIKGESNIYVPQNKVGELRLKIAGEGLVGNNIKGYEVFDDSSAFGTTSLVQNINARRALEGELARTIMSLPAINNARVHLVIPKKRLFLKENTKPTASVVVNLGSRILEAEQINSITYMIASAVPDLLAENVAIIDNRGKLLSSGDGESDMNKLSTSQNYKAKLESKYQSQLTNMLETIVGIGKANVKVTAEIDMNRTEETAEIYDPTTQVVRSEQVSEEENKSKGASPAVVGTQSNLNSNDGSDKSEGSAAVSNQTATNSTVNYEISKTVRHSIKQAGKITRLSVAVVLEGTYKNNHDGTKSYVPMLDAQLSKIKTLIQSAVGFNEKRGDMVEVIDLPFSQIEEVEDVVEPLFSNNDIIKIIEYAMMMVGFIVMVFFVIKPILSTTNSVVKAKMPPPVAIAPEVTISDEDDEEEEEEDTLVAVSNVEGKVREASIKKAANIIENHPDESTQVIKRWMLTDAADK